MSKQPFENVVQYLFQITARAEFKTLNDQDLLKRYVEHRDELAFGELVRRYKGMIWHVCWRVLRHQQDVEDTFQATIMTLVRRAKTVLGRESIEGWLHKVAYHVATKAKVMQARRYAREERRAKMGEKSYDGHESRYDLSEVLDKELTHIPEKYRGPLLLCYMEGLTWNEAAQRLGISIDSLEWRLEQGRRRLKQRLSRYGLEWGPTMLVPQAASGIHIPEIPSRLVEKTLDMVRIMTLSNGAVETARVSPQVAVLIKGTISVWTVKVKICLGVLMLTVVGISTGVAKYPGFFLNLIGWKQPRETRPDPVNDKGTEPHARPTPPRVDRYGDPLPPGALERLGTVRFRTDGEKLDKLVITPDRTNPIIMGHTADGVQLRLWDFTTGKPLYRFHDAQGQAVTVPTTRDRDGGQTRAVWAMSHDGRLLAKCDQPGEEYHFWDMSTRQLLKLRLKENPQCLAISADGTTVAVMDGAYLRSWDSTTGKRQWECKKENYEYSHLVYSADGKILMSVVREQKLKNKGGKTVVCRWVASTGEQLTPWTIADQEISDFTWSRDGSTLAILPEATRNVIRLWHMDTGRPIRSIRVEGKSAQLDMRLALSPDGKILATGVCYPEEKGETCLWDTATGQRLHDSSSQSAGPQCLTFSCDGKWLTSTSVYDHAIRIWKVDSGELVNREWLQRGGRTEVHAVAFSLQGKASVSTANSPKRNSLDRGEWSNVRQVAISSDGQILAAISNVANETDKANKHAVYSEVYLWHVDTSNQAIRFVGPRLLTKLKTDEADGSTLTFSPDRRLLAVSSSGSPVIRVWEIATGQERCHWNDHSHSSLNSCPLSFSPDSRRLASGHKNTTALIWDLTGLLKEDLLCPLRLSSPQMETRWVDLASADAARASRALWSLVAAGSPTVSFLRKRLRSIQRTPVQAETLIKLIADLDHTIVAVRKKAREELKKIGEAAETSLCQALNNQPSLEKRCEVEELLKAMAEARDLLVPSSPEVLRSLRVIEVLEQINTPEARQLLEELSHGAAGTLQTLEAQAALRRLQQVQVADVGKLISSLDG